MSQGDQSGSSRLGFPLLEPFFKTTDSIGHKNGDFTDCQCLVLSSAATICTPWVCISGFMVIIYDSFPDPTHWGWVWSQPGLILQDPPSVEKLGKS